MTSRREVLAGGVLLVSFASVNFGTDAADAQGEFGTTPSHVDPARLDSWLSVGADGRITAYTGKCDFGQGMLTAQTQLVAEELCVPLEHVTLVECDTAVCPDQGTTSGSQSTPVNFNGQNLALAAATAREALLVLAAQVLSEPQADLTPESGVIAGRKGRKVTYGELLGGKRFNVTLSRTAKRKSEDQWTVLGKPVASLDHTNLMTGRFDFVHHVRVKGMRHGRIVRPPRMGATLVSVDRQSVKNLAGNVTVVVRKDFVGVVADTQNQAAKAARQLAVRWNPVLALPSHETFFSDIQEQPSHDALMLDSADTDAVLSGTAQVLRGRYTYPYQMHGSIGASCAVADVRRDGATIWSATQSAYPTRSVIAKLLGIPQELVRVIYKRGSGCYGLNGADAVSFDAAVLSQVVGKPVRLQYTRQDEMKWENFGNPCLVEHRAGLTSDGRIAVWRRENWVPSLGNRPGYDRPGNVVSGMLLGYESEPFQPAPAKVPTGKLNNNSNAVPGYLAGCAGGACGGTGNIKSERVLTRTVRSPFFTGPLRSPQRIQNTFANECFMDELCAAAKADPVEFRLKHLSDPRTIGVVKAVATLSRWDHRPFPKGGSTRTGIVSGRGIACVAYEGRNGYAALVAEVEVDLDTGVVRPRRVFVALDCGPVSNPDGLLNQIEGGVLQGTSRALVEEVTWDENGITSFDWATYPSLRMDYDIPVIESVFVSPAGVSATGAGETAVTVTPAAIGNAIFDAAGVRLRDVPFTQARMRAALDQLTLER